MRQNTWGLLCLLASSASALPFPSHKTILQECSQYASCRPFYQIAKAHNKARESIHESSFPIHSTIPAEDVSIPILEPSPKQLHNVLVGFSNSDSRTLFSASNADSASNSETPVTDSQDQLEPPVIARASARLRKMGNSLTTGCHRAAEAAKSTTSASYSYGVTYVKKDYTDFLVVSVVVLFLLAVVLVEIMENILYALGFFRPEQRIEQLVIEDEDEEPLPKYTPPYYDIPPSSPPPTCTCGREKVGKGSQ